MAVNTIPLQQSRKPHSLWLVFAMLFLMAAVVVVTQAHAVQRHGAEAEAIRKCLENNDPSQIWWALDGETFYRLCQLDDGRWGLQAITKEGNTWYEKTAFIRGDGSWQALMKYLQKFATRFAGPLP